jgi:hypothetical protein
MSDTAGAQAAYNLSPEGQLLNATINAIIDLDLPDIEGNVWLRPVPTPKGINTRPVVLVTPLPASHVASEGTITAPDLLFQQAVAFVYDGNRSVDSNAAARLYVQHALTMHFAKNASAVSASLVDGCHLLWSGVTMGDPRMIERWRENIDAGWIFIAHKVRYPSTA